MKGYRIVMEQIVIGFGGLLIAIYVLNTLRRPLGDRHVKIRQIMLILMGTVTMISALTLDATHDLDFGMLETVALAIALALGLISLFRLFSSTKPLNSPAFLGLGSAGIVVVGAFAIPFYAQSLPEPPLLIETIPGNDNTPGIAENLIRIFEDETTSKGVYPVQANVMLIEPTPASTAHSIPTIEQPKLFFPTPTTTSILLESCNAIVTTNLNFRHLPSTSAGDVMSVVPADEVVTLLAQDSSGEWWYAGIDNIFGWLFGDLLNLSEECMNLPIRNWN